MSSGCQTCGGFGMRHDPVAHGTASEPTEVVWHCICGSGDDAEMHSLMCVASNTPDEIWHDEPDPFAPGTRAEVHELDGGYLVIPSERDGRTSDPTGQSRAITDPKMLDLIRKGRRIEAERDELRALLRDVLVDYVPEYEGDDQTTDCQCSAHRARRYVTMDPDA